MRQGSNRRPRNRHHGGGNGGNGGSMGNRQRSAASLRHQSFDSNCGDLRVRGNAWQVYEKYQALARDASSSGDRIAAENYLQHAEHYCRIIKAIDEAAAAEQRLHSEAAVAASQQPETPANYYSEAPVPGAAKGGAQQAKAPARGGRSADKAPEAEVAAVKAPAPAAATEVKSSPFFTQEEIEEQRGDASKTLAAAR